MVLTHEQAARPRRLGGCPARRRLLAGVSGSLVVWLVEYDILLIADMPDNASAAAFSIAVSAGGSVKACKTTPLMTPAEAVEAMGQGRRVRVPAANRIISAYTDPGCWRPTSGRWHPPRLGAPCLSSISETDDIT